MARLRRQPSTGSSRRQSADSLTSRSPPGDAKSGRSGSASARNSLAAQPPAYAPPRCVRCTGALHRAAGALRAQSISRHIVLASCNNKFLEKNTCCWTNPPGSSESRPRVSLLRWRAWSAAAPHHLAGTHRLITRRRGSRPLHPAQRLRVARHPRYPPLPWPPPPQVHLRPVPPRPRPRPRRRRLHLPLPPPPRPRPRRIQRQTPR